jgi:hypothetical protein
MPELDGVKYDYDEAGMREYMKAKNAKNKAMHGKELFPMNDLDMAKEGDEFDAEPSSDNKDTNNDGIVDVLESTETDNSAVTDEGGKPGDIDGDGIPENYVDSDIRKGNLNQKGWRRYVDKNLGMDLELLADDFKKSFKNPVFTKAPSMIDLPSNPTKYKYGGTPSRVKGVGGAAGQNVPGMYHGRNK